MVFKQFKPNDISITPFIAHKQWEVNSADTSSGVVSYFGQFYNGNFKTVSINDLPSTTDNKNVFLIHQSIASMFTDNYADEPLNTMGITNNKQERVLYENVHVISVPQRMFGERLKRNTINIDINLPGNNQLFTNPTFLVSQSVLTCYYANIPDTGSWYIQNGNTGSIINEQLVLTNAIGTQNIIGQLINQNVITSSKYMLTIDVASNNVPELLGFVIQNTYPLVTFSIDITNTNTQIQSEIQLYSGQDAIIGVLDDTLSIKTIIFNQISVAQIESHNIKDDGYGNLYDVAYSQSSAETKTTISPNIIGEWNFRNGYQKKNQYLTDIYTRDSSRNKNNGLLHNVMFTDGLYSTAADFSYVKPKSIETITTILHDVYGNEIKYPVNVMAILPDNYVQVKYDDYRNLYNFKRDDDFCISGMIRLHETASYIIPTVLYESDIINNYKLQNSLTSSYTLVGYLTSSYNRASMSYDTITHNINYNIKPYDEQQLTNTDKQTIITKNGLMIKPLIKNNITDLVDIESYGPYPFAIEVDRSSGSAILNFSRYDGKNKIELTSSISIPEKETHHFICQKTGSYLEMYIDGVLVGNINDLSEISMFETGSLGDTHNQCDLFIGALGKNKQYLNGVVDELKIFDKSLTQNQANILAQNELSGSYNYIVGNVFYEYGILTIASPTPHYENFIKQIPYNPVQDYILDGGRNVNLILTNIGGGRSTASYYLYAPMSGGFIPSSSYPYWPAPYSDYPTNNYPDGGDSTSSYVISHSYDGNI